MDEVDEELTELADLDDISNRSSACDCPAHVHDREFPLEIAKVQIIEKYWHLFDANLLKQYCPAHVHDREFPLEIAYVDRSY